MNVNPNLPPTISPELTEQYIRDAKRLYGKFGEAYGSPVSLSDVLQAHYVVVDFCLSENLGEGVGGIGPRDDLLLVSAIDRQSVALGSVSKWKDFEHQVASLLYGLVKNHPFHDANKRTALLVLVKACFDDGKYLSSEKSDTEDMLVYLASDSLHLLEGFEDVQDSEDAEIEFVAEFIRRNTRKIDKRTYFITYRELEKKLNSFGFIMKNPDNNYIDIVSAVDGRRILRTGFPGWSRQVAKGDMRKILNECNLDVGHGIDAEVFFHNEDPIYFFASDYRAQIASLAFR